MIFVTVGEQLPFDRLLKTVDDWAADSNEHIVAQTGLTTLLLEHIHRHQPFYPVTEYRRLVGESSLIIAHAGMGTIITAVEMQKSLLMMPRRKIFGEIRSDHQLATMERFSCLPGIAAAHDEKDLIRQLRRWPPPISAMNSLTYPWVDDTLIETIKRFVNISTTEDVKV